MWKRRFIGWGLVLGLLLGGPAAAAAEKSKTPTDVYNLAQSIDYALTNRYNLNRFFKAPVLTDNAKARNVFQKALGTVREFRALGIGGIDQAELNKAAQVDPDKVKPDQVYALLKLIEVQLRKSGIKVQESTYDVGRKTPSQVFALLRRLSAHHRELAAKLEIEVDWGTPGPVYDLNVRRVLPAVQAVADKAGVEYKPFRFPKIPLKKVYPRHVFMLQRATYNNLAEYFRKTAEYEPIEFKRIVDTHVLNPGDVADVTRIFLGELGVLIGYPQISMKTLGRYEIWARGRKITPGDVIQLVQYNFVLSRRIAALAAD